MIKLIDVYYSYKHKQDINHILSCVNYEFEAAKCYAITGKSGSGKTTLISLISGMDYPSSGEIQYNGTNIREMDLNQYRAKIIGVIFQNYNLLLHLNAIENVQLALRLSGVRQNINSISNDLLEQVAIGKSVSKRNVTTLSGGEQQRVAIARALAGEPNVIIADEPTGNLDEENGKRIMDIFLDLAHMHGKCVIIASHSSGVIKSADHILTL